MADDLDPALDDTNDDAEFRRGVRARDPRAWERMVLLFDQTLRRQASWLLPSRLDTDGAVAEVWFRAILNVRRYDPARSPLPWLARICTNICLNLRRGPSGRRREPLDPSLAAPARVPAEDPDARREACRDALARLPKRDREIVTLRFLFGLPASEIAVLLGVAHNTVDHALVRGIERLKRGPSAVGLAEWAEVGGLEGVEGRAR